MHADNIVLTYSSFVSDILAQCPVTLLALYESLALSFARSATSALVFNNAGASWPGPSLSLLAIEAEFDNSR